MKIIVLGLSVTSSWGNGHATTYRALLAALRRRGHHITFFEKNEEWYSSNRDLPSPGFCEVRLFDEWSAVLPSLRSALHDCDVAVLGSYFPHGIAAAEELINSDVPVRAFYDIDTPITIKRLHMGGAEYLKSEQVPGFDLYLSFTAGPILQHLQNEFGARRALPLYCSFEAESYYPQRVSRKYKCDMSYMGTYAADRQAKLEELFTRPAEVLSGSRFILAGPQYPAALRWPRNVKRINHLSPSAHASFYSSSKLTLNLTRADMVGWGFSPSVRLFEAAACGCPIVSDAWPGLGTILKIGEEVLVAEKTEDVVALLRHPNTEELRAIGLRARERVLAEHSSDSRARQFEDYVALAARIPVGGSRATSIGGISTPQAGKSKKDMAQIMNTFLAPQDSNL